MPPVENPYAKKRHPKVAKVAPTAPPKPRYGHAQEAFILHTRTRLEEDKKFFEENHWDRISYRDKRHHAPLASNGKMSVDELYVKDIACWVPHLITKGY